jgi:uncharacterized membrane protein YgcG
MGKSARLAKLWLGVLCVVVWLSSVGPAHAGKTLEWTRLDSDITVLLNGDLRIVETNVIDFTGGTFTFGYRDVDMSRLTSIHVEGASQDGLPLRYETSLADQRNFRIQYYFPIAIAEQRTFILTYTVQGATRYYPDGDQVYWSGVYAARNGFPVLNSRVTVHLPDGAVASNAGAYGPAYTLSGAGTNVVVAEASEPIASGQEFEMRVQFPHGIITGSPAAWQLAFDQERDFEENVKPRNNFGFLLIALLLGIGGPALAVVLWFVFGRDPYMPRIADSLNEPPADLPPGLAGTLIDERADMQDIVATLVDLARRGVVLIKEGSATSYYDQTFARGPNFPARTFDAPASQSAGDIALASHERALVVALDLDRKQENSLSQMRDLFYQFIPGIQGALYGELVARGCYHNSPDESRHAYSQIARSLLIAAGVFGALCVIWLWRVADTAILVAIGLALAGLALLLVARAMPVRTRKGAEMRERAEAFRRYLQNIEKYTDVKTATDLYDRYLPYAIACGLDRTWTQKFAAAKAPAPAWYVPRAGEWHWRADPDESIDERLTRTQPQTAGASPGANAAGKGDISGAAMAPVTLESVNQNLSRALTSVNDGLTSMFSSVAGTFASHPPPESVTNFKNTMSDVGGTLGDWLNSAAEKAVSSNDSSRSSSSSHRSSSWSGGGSRGGGSSGGGGGGFG